MAYRLGLDLGANSIGWCVLRLDPAGAPAELVDVGVRVHPDGRNPKDGSSLAAARRLPRSMRRNRDRYLQRRANLLSALSGFGLMPTDADERKRISALDPYALRAAALHRRLESSELGRVIFHLNQHRGFKSNRKVDRGSNESGLIRQATTNTAMELARTGHLTVGSWLADRHARREAVRVRLAGSGKTAAYPFYPLRSMIEAEFDAIWATQARWNTRLTDPIRDALKSIVFHQRPLKPPVVGKCWLEPEEDRARRALPTAQRFRVAQNLSHLRLSQLGMPERPLSSDERAVLTGLLYRGKDLTFDQVRKKLRLPTETDFNTREEKIVGDATAARLGGKKIVGPAWFDLSLAAQDAAVSALLDAEAADTAITALEALGIPTEAAARAADAALPVGHAALSAKAQSRILPHLEAGLRYDQAVPAAGYAHHSDTRTGEIRDRLPYYGELLHARIGTGTGILTDPPEKRLGRAPNPTVHVALNELRRVVNAIVERHGPPSEIVVETLRELGRSKKQRQEYEREQKKNRDANDARRKMLAEMGRPVNAANLMRLRLWEEQAADEEKRMCPYTGEIITSVTALSDAIEEDHILPFSASLDDGAANRVLVTRDANRRKAKRTPNEAFGHSEEWPAILERVKLLPPQKHWRFQPDALEKFKQEGDFLARHLTDSATIARWATEYLQILTPGKVWSVPGRLTSLLRRALGLGSRIVLGKGAHGKDRDDHRHHAIDAVVVGLIDRGLLMRVTLAAKRAENRGDRLMLELEPTWESFVSQVASKVQGIVVSHKPDTGWQGALHNDTAYGQVAGAKAGEPNVVVRRPLESLLKWSPDDIRASVRDLKLGAKVAAALDGCDDAARKSALARFTHAGGHQVRRVRMVERLDGVKPITDRHTGQPYKLVKRDSNHRAEIWRLPQGRLKMTLVSTFDAARMAEAARLGKTLPDPRPHPAAKLLMRLHKNDMVAFGHGAGRQILRVVKMSEGVVVLAPSNEAGNLKDRDAAKDDSFKYVSGRLGRLEREDARKVHVTPDGQVLDSGPVS